MAHMNAKVPKREDAVMVDGVRVTHPLRVVYPTPNITKLEVVRYYESVAASMLPHLQGRPLTLVACMNGIEDGCQYLRHSKVWGPSAIRRVRIREKTKIGEYMIADTPAALLSLAQLNVLEFHTWNVDFDRDVERPNRILFDLDAGPEVTWPQVIAAAKLVRKMLAALDLDSWVKTTGGRGLHVVVPVKPVHDWTKCLAFARAIAELLVTQDVALYTTNFRKSGRERQILVDYLRNNRTNTSISALSLRARTGAPVSMPIAWDDLTSAKHPERFALKTVSRYLKVDPWRDYWRSRQPLTNDALQAVGVRSH
jgi:bifunctional non-homologous end joining protein LigD